MVMITFKPSTGETKAGGSLLVPEQPGLHSEYQDSQIYTERSCLKNKKEKHKKERKKKEVFTNVRKRCQYEK